MADDERPRRPRLTAEQRAARKTARNEQRNQAAIEDADANALAAGYDPQTQREEGRQALLKAPPLPVELVHTYAEAWGILKVSESNFFRKLKTGEGPEVTEIMGQPRILHSDLLIYIAARDAEKNARKAAAKQAKADAQQLDPVAMKATNVRPLFDAEQDRRAMRVSRAKKAAAASVAKRTTLPPRRSITDPPPPAKKRAKKT